MIDFLDGIELTDDVKTLITSEFNKLNDKFVDAKTSRDNLKNTIREKLEIESLADLDSKLKSNDNSKEIATFKQTIEQLQSEITSRDEKLSQITTKRITEQAVNSSLDGLGIINNPVAKQALEAALLEDTKIIDGKVVPMTTASNGVEIPLMVNGKEISLAEKAKMILDKPEYSIFKDVQVKRGVGSREPISTGHKDLSKMTLKEKFDYYNNK